MDNITHYIAHDPVSNSEGIVTEFDPELISRAAESGIVFIAVDADGNRAIVQPDDVKEPAIQDERFTIVQPQYVDDRMSAVVDVFDALQAIIAPEASAASYSLDADAVEAGSSDPFALFCAKLSALRAIAVEGAQR